MSEPAVRLDNVSKRYLLGEGGASRRGGSLRDSVTSRLRLAPPRIRGEMWALRDVSFEVPHGQAIGIVGRNGAGKTTVLKILSRITHPTSGVATTSGRVGALLEVGTGFHPELTGRENVYLNGAILGMRRSEIDRRFDDIVDFSGIPAFVDTPVKRYSSGMRLRLAFSVAAHLQAEILFVDEVIAVGDAEFQRRCLQKLAEIELEGRTVILVSHNLEAISRLCRRALWIEEGTVRSDGPTAVVLDAYLDAGRQGTLERGEYHRDDEADIALRSIDVRQDGARRPTADNRRPIELHMSFVTRRPVADLDVAFTMINLSGATVLAERAADELGVLALEPGVHDLVLTVPPVLNRGDHVVGVRIIEDGHLVMEEQHGAFVHLDGRGSGTSAAVLHLGEGWSCTSSTEP